MLEDKKLKLVVDRINRMEGYFHEVCHALLALDNCIKEDREIQRKIRELTDYYENGMWLQDYECDERGELPSGLKRGVLSQDALYDLLVEINQDV